MENKLKTLKDIHTFLIEDHEADIELIPIEELRTKVVKWVKEDRNLRKDNTIWTINQDELLDLLEDRWMNRFNLTEEDIKEVA